MTKLMLSTRFLIPGCTMLLVIGVLLDQHFEIQRFEREQLKNYQQDAIISVLSQVQQLSVDD